MIESADGRRVPRLVSLRLAANLLIAGHILATAIALTTIFVWTLQGTIEQAQDQLLRLLTPPVARVVDSQFQAGRALLDELVSGVEAGRATIEDTEATALQFARYLRYQPQLAWVSWSDDASGRYVGATRTDGNRILLHYSDPAVSGGSATEFLVRDDGGIEPFHRPLPGGYDPRTRPWYRAAAATNRAVWTSVSEFYEGVPGITSARAAYRSDGRLWGVFTVDFFAKDVEEFVAELQVGRGGSAFVANRDGAIVSPALARADRNLLSQTLRQRLRADETDDFPPVRLHLADGEYLLALRPLPISFDRDWLCGILFPASEVHSLFWQRLRAVGLVTALVILSAVLAGSILSSTVARLVTRAVRDVRDLAADSTRSSVPRAPSRIAEIRWLQETLGRLRAAFQEAQRMEAERQHAIERTRAKSEVLAMVTHDLRAPLQSIAGHCSLVLHSVPPPPDTCLRSIQAIARAGDRMNHMLNDMLDLARIEAGRLPIRVQRFDPEEAILECVDLMRIPAANRGLALRVRRDGPPIEMHSDPARLRQILLNLLDNAVRYTLQGHIDVEFGEESGCLRLIVRDTGLGMSPEQANRLFQAFEPGPHGETRKDSHGLGLAICRQLATLLDGTIDVESAENIGTAFTVRLPLRHVSGHRTADDGQNGLEERPVKGMR